MPEPTAKPELRRCTRCVIDDTVPSVRYDEKGVCNFCKKHDVLFASMRELQTEAALASLVEKVRRAGKGKAYDCIVGVSGGTDSTYVLYRTKQLGLRPLAVHFDDGWNSEIAVSNIKNAVNKLGVDLETYVVDWEEMKDLQRSFFRASVPNPGIPTDVGIFGALFRVAFREKLRYIFGGQSFMTEGMQPREWSYIDGTYVKSVHEQFGEGKLKTFPNVTMYEAGYYTFLRGVRIVPLLNYSRYDKAEARKELEREVEWEYYGGHHYENVFCRFIYTYYDYRKFNSDRRKVTLSAEIRSGLVTRTQALSQLEKPPEIPEETVQYCISKLGFTPAEFQRILQAEPKLFRDFKTSYPVLRAFGFLLGLAVRLRLVTPVLYQKYLG